jgi:enterobactin synthetase component D
MKGAQQLNLGPLQLYWLDKRESIASLPFSLTHDEQRKSETIKAISRRDEFVRSRLLLRSLTNVKTSFLPDAENSPTWPPGMCGSITHKNGHVAVCTTSKKLFLSVGIDAEDARKDISHLQEKICTQNDLKWVESICGLTEMKRGAIIALIFSAKEALFKCHFPLGRKMFWFHDAEVSQIDLKTGLIKLKVLIDTSPNTLKDTVTSGNFVLNKTSDSEYWVTAFSLQL